MRFSGLLLDSLAGLCTYCLLALVIPAIISTLHLTAEVTMQNVLLLIAVSVLGFLLLLGYLFMLNMVRIRYAHLFRLHYLILLPFVGAAYMAGVSLGRIYIQGVAVYLLPAVFVVVSLVSPRSIMRHMHGK